MGRYGRFIPLLILAGVIALVFAMGWNRYLSLETLTEHGEALRAYVAQNYLLALLLVILIFAAATASVIPGVFFVTITAGYLFGPWIGGVATALAVYFVVRTALGEALRQRFERDQGMMHRVCQAIDKDTFWYVLASRLAVVVPFHMINVAAGLMAVRLMPYSIATFIGLLPAHIIYCWIGSRLNTLLADDPDPDFQALFAQFWAPMLGVFVLAVVLPVVMKTAQAAWAKRKGGEGAS